MGSMLVGSNLDPAASVNIFENAQCIIARHLFRGTHANISGVPAIMSERLPGARHAKASGVARDTRRISQHERHCDRKSYYSLISNCLRFYSSATRHLYGVIQAPPRCKISHYQPKCCRKIHRKPCS